MTGGGTTGWDYFVSYAQADRAAAEWIAYELESTGARVLIQAWDFVPGTNWPELIQRGVTTAKVLIPVLSADYLTSAGGTAEWQAVWAADISGQRRRVVPILITDPGGLDLGLAGTRAWIDLHDLSAADVAAARARLLDGLNAAQTGRAKPTGRVPFSGGRSAARVNAGPPKRAGSRTPPVQSAPDRDSSAPETRQPASEPAPATEATRWSTAGLVSRAEYLRPARRATSGPFYDANRRILERGHPVRLIGPTGPAAAVTFAPDKPVLAAAFSGPSGGVWRWDVADPAAAEQFRSPLTGAVGGMTSVVFAPNGTTLAAGGADGRIFRWDVASLAVPQPVGPPLTGPTDAVRSIAFSPDGTVLAASDGRTILLWDVATWSQIGPPLTGPTGIVESVAFAPNGRTLAAGACADPKEPEPLSTGGLWLWDVSAPANPRLVARSRKTGGLSGVAFAPDGRTLAAASNLYREAGRFGVYLWDVTGGAYRIVDAAEEIASTDTCLAEAQTAVPKARGLARYAAISGTATISRIATFAVAISPNGLILASGRADGMVWRWDVANPAASRRLGPLLTGYAGPTGPVRSIAFAPNGRTLAAASGTVSLWVAK
ncbi:WD40 repeat-containing protein [Frankia sp. CcI6]|uniref:toll/interleukin-1 receptor domain-containing protein n=1 Tax=Frankia TaxID=1854 RepID=UPI0003CFE2AB|nr:MULTISPECIES: TIR domain-containing protein [Frankia]ETA01678.1 WD40 repeat-containing protein [Frankia sp. CcI6]OAA29070.1 WD40 repeat-containing protein [Frankia casuarinae]OHV48536.1 hypothetical protein CgIS1_05865 [Frankia sp. CgIS1]